MNQDYINALDGTLKSVQSGNPFQITITNGFEIPVIVYWIDTDGQQVYAETAQASGNVVYTNANNGDFYLVTSAYSGAFMALVAVSNGTKTYSVSCMLVASPNNIGPVPQPSSQVIVPPDSPRVLVACGTVANGNFVTREQFWQRQPESYCLAPGESKTVSTTVTSGMQQTSSNQETVTASLGLSTSAGWGPVSASVSASLSASSTQFQQVTLSQQSTSYVSDSLTNTEKNPVMFLRWQLVDVITVFDNKGAALASTISGENPILTQGPYNLQQLLGASSASAAPRGKKPAPIGS